MDNIVHNLIYSFLEEVVIHNDNYPTKISLLLYSYFQMFYNIASLCNKNIFLTADRVGVPNWYNELKNQLQYVMNKEDILQNMIFYGHIGFLSSLYNNFEKNKYKILDYGIKDVKLSNVIIQNMLTWGSQHYLGKLSELENLSNDKNYTGILADISGNINFIAENPNKWTNLIVPNGKYNENGFPIIDINADTTYEIQSFIDKNWWLNRGFAINPSRENIINLDEKIISTWENGLNTQTEKILKIYENLDDRKKTISELYSFDTLETGSISGFWVIIAMMLSKKNNQNTENDIIMFFILGAGLYDSSIASWTYKAKYELPRPITVIRHFLKDKPLNQWNIGKNSEIEGKNWMPYQKLTTVSPPNPDLADINTVFSVVAGSLLEWWFNNPNLNHSFKLFSLPNPHLISSILNKQYKSFSIGEFCIEKGSSLIEPSITPSQTMIFKYKTIKELIDDISSSSIYGGISFPISIELSTEIGNYVFQKIKSKIENIYKIKIPY